MRSRWAAWLLIGALWACVPAPVQAQAPRFAGIPIATDLRQVPVGAWSRYLVRHPFLSQVEMTVTLLARDRTSATLEATFHSWNSPDSSPRWTVQGPVSLLPGRRAKGRFMMRAGKYDPMLLPEGSDRLFPPLRVERKQLVRGQTVQVPAGTFQTQYFRKRHGEATADLWASAKIHPLGVAQLQSVPVLRGISVVGPFSANSDRHPYEPMGDADVRVEAWQLLAQGTGGRSMITKRPRPFDAEVMRNQVLESMMYPNKSR
jgi:hypothetical protein